jgi:polysaccharide chain length determinant protein (PEP-CTERM system associated)
MSVEFRQRTPGEYLQIVRRRKWLIILPVIAITCAVAWVVYRLPDVYQSSTLIVVRPATLPNSVVPQVNEDSITRQLTSIAQVVTSRSSLEPLVMTYDLYKVERMRGEPMESVIAMMRRDIDVQVNTSRNDITNGFNISFKNRDPKTTQAVTAELASKYISEQTKNTVNAGTMAKEFIDNQVRQAQEELDAVDKRRYEFMTTNLGNLPSQGTTLLAQLNGLREQQKALMTEIGRLQDRRSGDLNQVALMKQSTEVMKGRAAEDLTDPKTTLAWSQLLTRKAQLQGELTRIKQELRDKHPDVIGKQKEIDQVQADMDQMVAEWKDKIREKEERLNKMPDVGVANLEANIKFIDNEIKRQQGIYSQNESAIGQIVAQINKVPGAEVELAAIERDYGTKKAALDGLLAQQQKIGLGKDAATSLQSEGINVVDAAYLPSQPVAPKRLILVAVGLGLGLAIGFLLTAIFEIPRLLTIQSTEDARHYTGLPVLMAVPELLTPQEARAIPRRRRLLLAAGFAITIVSIPVLAFALKVTHVFELLSQASGRA